MHALSFAPYFVLTTILMTVNPLLVKLSQAEDGRLSYSVPMAVLCAECVKAALSATLAFLQPHDTRTVSLRGALRFLGPAVLYFVANNLTFTVLVMLDAATFQITSELKILATALLFRFYLNRRLQLHQYAAIALVTCGTAVSQVPEGGACDDAHADRHDPAPLRPFLGILLNAVVCFISALGGIVNEEVLKDTMADSIHWQNTQLYTFGVALNGLAVAFNGTLFRHPFRGFDHWTVAIVLTNAFNGLAVSALLKFSDNITRVFAHAFAICLTMLANTVLFNIDPTPQMGLAVAIISLCLLLYHLKVRAARPAERYASPRDDPSRRCSMRPTDRSWSPPCTVGTTSSQRYPPLGEYRSAC